MTDNTHLIVKVKRWFGRVDYTPVNNIAKLFETDRGIIPAEKIPLLIEAGFTIEEN